MNDDFDFKNKFGDWLKASYPHNYFLKDFMRFLLMKLDASWKQRLVNKANYTTEDRCFNTIGKVMLGLDPIHLHRMGVIEMALKNGELLSLLIDEGNAADFKKITDAALYLHLSFYLRLL